MAYSGRYVPVHPHKYAGNPNNIQYRSHWELQTFRWCDANPDVVMWASEEIAIPYYWAVDNSLHRYFVDLIIKYKSGEVVMVEIKPRIQTLPPSKKGGKKPETLLAEALTFDKNNAKWDAAHKYAQERNWKFEVWTEVSLKKMGIFVNTPKPLKKLRTSAKTQAV